MKKIEPSQEFVKALKNESNRVIEEVLKGLPYSKEDPRETIKEIDRRLCFYAQELAKQGFSLDLQHAVISSSYRLFRYYLEQIPESDFPDYLTHRKQYLGRAHLF